MNIALIGYGKMGKTIEEIAIDRGHSVLLKIDEYNLADFSQEKIAVCDVAIEFTGPHTAYQNLVKAIQYNIPVVCGSTGWLEKMDEIKELCNSNNGSFIYASNFSVGVNIFFELNKKLASLMSAHNDYRVQVTEIHHTAKKDAPSGTAISLAEQIIDTLTRKTQWVNHASNDAGDLPILSERTDPAPGTHKVLYSSPIDNIEIIHTAHSRQGFALGAVLAAEYIHDKKGIFTMRDVLHL